MVLNLFNNANNGHQEVNATTGMSINIDMANHTASTFRNFTDPADPVYSVSQGSFQVVNPDTTRFFMGYGSMAIVREFDSAGNTIMSGQFGPLDAVASYRGYKCSWSSNPLWKPVVVAERTGDTAADVYMSWNGATEYDNWAIYTAPSQDSVDTTLVSTNPRTGFETKVSLSNLDTPYVQVVARKGDTVLGTSVIMNF